ncbi:MAG: hypothetical protein AAF941_03645 [Pseudomonadota bacterium]
MLTLFAPALMLLQSASPQIEQPPSAGPSTPPPACSTELHSAFDFWVGEWEVFPTNSDRQVAESRIERLFSGCAIREHWMPFQGSEGGSTSLVNHKTGRWEQVWIGGDGVRVDFTGGVVDGNMVLSGYWDDIGGPGTDALVRMTYTVNEDGSVRQFGEASADHGKTWQPSFDFLYRRKSTKSAEDSE